MSDIIVKTTGLCADFKIKDRMVRAVNRVSLSLERGKTLVILGESGSGKSTYMKALLRILPKTAAVEGQAEFLGNDLFRMSEKEFRDIRGNRMAMIYQDSLSALDPMYKVGYQIVETIRAHSSLTKAEARERVEELFVKVGIPSPRERMNAYPHEMSGGMRQRAMIAIALACSPKLLIADEPTTALDVTIQAQILNLIKRLNRELDMTTILITHDLGVVATLCDKVVVMYGGLIMEDGTVEEIFYHPKHPYTMGLIDSIPRVTGGEKQRLKPIPGTPPNLIHPPKGCPFSTRCPYCMNVCMEEMPPYFQEDGHRTMCWLLHEEAPVNPEYVQRKEAMRRADG